MFCAPVTSDEITKIICNLPNNKAPGMDNISAKVLKIITGNECIAIPLEYIFNLSFSTGIVPDLLKIAKVVPIHKKCQRNLAENYRPISLLSIFDKIMEKLMYKRLYVFFPKKIEFCTNTNLDSEKKSFNNKGCH